MKRKNATKSNKFQSFVKLPQNNCVSTYYFQINKSAANHKDNRVKIQNLFRQITENS